MSLLKKWSRIDNRGSPFEHPLSKRGRVDGELPPADRETIVILSRPNSSTVDGEVWCDLRELRAATGQLWTHATVRAAYDLAGGTPTGWDHAIALGAERVGAVCRGVDELSRELSGFILVKEAKEQVQEYAGGTLGWYTYDRPKIVELTTNGHPRAEVFAWFRDHWEELFR